MRAPSLFKKKSVYFRILRICQHVNVRYFFFLLRENSHRLFLAFKNDKIIFSDIFLVSRNENRTISLLTKEISVSKCEELRINGASMSCTDSNMYKSVCTIQCNAGRRRQGPAKQICRGLQVPSWQGVDEIGATKCG